MRFPTIRPVSLLTGLLLLPLALPAQTNVLPPPGQTTALTPIADEIMEDGINIPEAPLDSALGLLELLTGRTVLRAQNTPQVTFSLVVQQPISTEEALLAIETTLTMNGIAVAPLGDKFIKVVPIGNARTEAPELITVSSLELPPSGRIASKLFHLEFLRVSEFAGRAGNLLNTQLGGAILFDQANAMLVTDTISTLQRIEILLNELDRPVTAGITPKFYSLQYAGASDLVAKMRGILQGPIQQQLGTTTTYSADDRTNKIVLLADERLHGFFDQLIAKLDTRSDPNTRNEVIALKHADANEVATIVSQLVSGQTQAAARANSGRRPQTGANPVPQPIQPTPNAAQAAATAAGIVSNEFSSFVTILADERSNAVVVSGTVEDIRLLRELIDKIDVLLAQVRIEVVIAEVTLRDNSSTGISQLGLLVENGRLVGFQGSASGGSAGGVGNLLGEGAPDSGSVEESVIRSLATFDGWDLTSFLELTSTPRKNNANLLSVPAIVTTHNKEARIFVGQDTPVISSFLPDTAGASNINAGYRTTINSRKIGIELTVKPLIGVNGSVQLEITQKVEDIIDRVEIEGNQQPVVGSRETEQFVSVGSGEILVLGGLQRDTASNQTSRLGPIPFLGDFFGSRTRSKEKTDLLIFLRPIVLGLESSDNDSALQRLDEMPMQQKASDILEGRAPNES